MINRVAVALRVIEQLVISLDPGPGQLLLADIGLQRRRGENPPHKAQSADDRAAVALFGQIARIDDRRVLRMRRARLDIAARQGPHLPWPASQPRLRLECADLAVFEAARRKRDLHIGCR